MKHSFNNIKSNLIFLYKRKISILCFDLLGKIKVFDIIFSFQRPKKKKKKIATYYFDIFKLQLD